MRNPPWSRDELILALDLYIKNRQSPPGKTSTAIVKLSSVLNEMGKRTEGRLNDYRNPNGVYMKLMNFRSLDEIFVAAGRRGLTSIGSGDKEVWRDYAHNHEALSSAAMAIMANVASDAYQNAEEELFFADAEEGRLLTQQHFRRERKRELVEKKKANVIKRMGRLVCEACGFDYETTYGARGAGFIEVHHTKPLSTLTPGERTSTNDLALLCANCHRMIHARRPWLDVSELKKLVKQT